MSTKKRSSSKCVGESAGDPARTRVDARAAVAAALAAAALAGDASGSRARTQSLDVSVSARVVTWVHIAEQIDRAQRVLLREADTSRAVSALAKEIPCDRKRAERLVLAARLRLRRDATHTTREQTRDFLRAQLQDVIRLARARTKAVLVGVGIGLQEVEHVDDPDLRALNEAVKSLAVLDDVAGPPPPDPSKTEGAADHAAAVVGKHFARRVLDTTGEPKESE